MCSREQGGARGDLDATRDDHDQRVPRITGGEHNLAGRKLRSRHALVTVSRSWAVAEPNKIVRRKMLFTSAVMADSYSARLAPACRSGYFASVGAAVSARFQDRR